jgi:hypothetical protein
MQAIARWEIRFTRFWLVVTLRKECAMNSEIRSTTTPSTHGAALWRLGIVAVLIAPLLSGCMLMILPHEQQVTPAYYGQIVDRDTGTPIADVVVEVEAPRLALGTETKLHVSTQSDKDGNYAAGVKDNVSLLGTILDPTSGPYCRGHVTFSHPEYETLSFDTNVPKGREDPGGVCANERYQKDVSLIRATSN